MKRVAIIFLILIVGICLSPSAFAENFMVVYIHVDSGEIAKVFGANEVPKSPKLSKYGLVEAEKVNTEPLILKKYVSGKSYTTFLEELNPWCRYIDLGGWLMKVCKNK